MTNFDTADIPKKRRMEIFENIMEAIKKKPYVAPTIEEYEIVVEKGFAASALATAGKYDEIELEEWD